MIKALSTVILLLFVIPLDLSFAQGAVKGVKIYSGYLYQRGANPKASDMQCSVEFDSPFSFSRQSVSVLPDHLTYFIRFKNAPQFSKFVIIIYTNDDEEYVIDPSSEGKQVGINDEHHIFDSYLIYEILGSEINHLEIASTSGKDKGKYVLDQVEVHDNK
jgi:hypothetical protein